MCGGCDGQELSTNLKKYSRSGTGVLCHILVARTIFSTMSLVDGAGLAFQLLGLVFDAGGGVEFGFDGLLDIVFGLA